MIAISHDFLFFHFFAKQLLATMVTFFISKLVLPLSFSSPFLLGDISSGAATIPNLNTLGRCDSYQEKCEQRLWAMNEGGVERRVNIFNL